MEDTEKDKRSVLALIQGFCIQKKERAENSARSFLENG